MELQLTVRRSRLGRFTFVFVRGMERGNLRLCVYRTRTTQTSYFTMRNFCCIKSTCIVLHKNYKLSCIFNDNEMIELPFLKLMKQFWCHPYFESSLVRLWFDAIWTMIDCNQHIISSNPFALIHTNSKLQISTIELPEMSVSYHDSK